MTLQVARLGYATPRIAFKGKDFTSGVGSSGKGQSSSSSERTERPRRTETTKPKSTHQPESTVGKTVRKAAGKITEAATDTIKVTRAELLEKLAKYSDDATMVRIITEQLRKLG